MHQIAIKNILPSSNCQICHEHQHTLPLKINPPFKWQKSNSNPLQSAQTLNPNANPATLINGNRATYRVQSNHQRQLSREPNQVNQAKKHLQKATSKDAW